MPRPASEAKIRKWRMRLQQQKISGLSINRWCKENQVINHQFYYWKTRLNDLSRNTFIEIEIPKSTSITLEYKGIHIQLDEQCNPETLKRCLRLLKSC